MKSQRPQSGACSGSLQEGGDKMKNIFGLIYLIGFHLPTFCCCLRLPWLESISLLIFFSDKGLQLKLTQYGFWSTSSLTLYSFSLDYHPFIQQKQDFGPQMERAMLKLSFYTRFNAKQQRFDNVGLKPKGCVCRQATTTRRVSTLLHESQFGGSNSGLKQARP